MFIFIIKVGDELARVLEPFLIYNVHIFSTTMLCILMHGGQGIFISLRLECTLPLSRFCASKNIRIYARLYMI